MMDKNNAELVVKVYSVLFWIGALFSIIGALGVLFMGSYGMFGMMSGSMFAGLGVVLAVLMLVLAVFYALAGFGLWGHKEWARIAAIVLSVISLLSFPFGTIVGALGIYFFAFEETVKGLFSGTASLAAMKQSAMDAKKTIKKKM